MLRHLVGNDGAVCSVDVDREMSERAAQLLQMAGHSNVLHSNVLLRTGDGRRGWAEYAPFDLVAWAVGGHEILALAQFPCTLTRVALAERERDG